MSVYKKQKIQQSFPAYDIVLREKDCMGYINVTANETLTNEEGLYGWTLGSCASYALENNECPIKSYERAVELNHSTHWLNCEAACVSAMSEKGPVRILVEDNDIIRFEGRLFTLAKAPNNNRYLVPYSAE